MTALAVNINSNSWYVDSGATCHMTNNKNLLEDYVVDTPRLVTVAIVMMTIFVPGLSTKLISIGKMASKGLEVRFDTKKCNVYSANMSVASATKVNGVYELESTINKWSRAGCDMSKGGPGGATDPVNG